MKTSDSGLWKILSQAGEKICADVRTADVHLFQGFFEGINHALGTRDIENAAAIIRQLTFYQLGVIRPVMPVQEGGRFLGSVTV